MPRKLTTDEVKSKATARHSGKYTYENFVYVGMDDKSTITCQKHGNFEQTPKEHLKGVGCFKCAVEDRARRKTLSQDEFVNRVESKYPNMFDLSGTEYKGVSNPVTVFCKVCNKYFTTKADKLLNRHGCNHCGLAKSGLNRRNSQDYILEKFESVPDAEKYDFSKVVYTLYKEPVDILCRTHDKIFKITPDSFLSGARCPLCSVNGYKRGDQGHLYVLEADNITKVGISNRKLNRRSKEISTSSGMNFSIKDSWFFNDGQVPYDIETALLRELRTTHKQPTEIFDGSTECFYDVDHDWLLSRIEQLIKEFTNDSRPI